MRLRKTVVVVGGTLALLLSASSFSAQLRLISLHLVHPLFTTSDPFQSSALGDHIQHIRSQRSTGSSDGHVRVASPHAPLSAGSRPTSDPDHILQMGYNRAEVVGHKFYPSWREKFDEVKPAQRSSITLGANQVRTASPLASRRSLSLISASHLPFRTTLGSSSSTTEKKERSWALAINCCRPGRCVLSLLRVLSLSPTVV